LEVPLDPSLTRTPPIGSRGRLRRIGALFAALHAVNEWSLPSSGSTITAKFAAKYAVHPPRSRLAGVYLGRCRAFRSLGCRAACPGPLARQNGVARLRPSIRSEPYRSDERGGQVVRHRR